MAKQWRERQMMISQNEGGQVSSELCAVETSTDQSTDQCLQCRVQLHWYCTAAGEPKDDLKRDLF